MAKKATKDLAKANTAALKNLHIISLSINVVFLLFRFLFRSRSLILYILFSIPAVLCEYILETTGRPKYTATSSSSSTLKSPGEDLAAPVLTEYMFDVVWVTWAALGVVMLFGNWGWLLWAVVPIYGAVKGVGLFGTFRGMTAPAQGGDEQMQQPMQGNRRQRRA